MFKYKAIFFDFDGVLCFDRFFESTCKDKYPQILEFKYKVIFQSDQKYADRWMRGEFTCHEIDKVIAGKLGLDVGLLNSLLLDSIRDMGLDERMLDIVSRVRESSIPFALVTNNMDTFNEITLPTRT